MSIKLTDTQLVLLSAAAQRKDRCLVAPETLKGGASQKVAKKLISMGLAKENKAKRNDPIWSRDEQSGALYTLKLTVAGTRAIGIDDSIELENTPREDGALKKRDPLRRPVRFRQPSDQRRAKSALDGLHEGLRLEFQREQRPVLTPQEINHVSIS